MCKPVAAVLLMLTASLVNAQDGVHSTGQFDYRIPPVDIHTVPGLARGVGATLAFEIKSTVDVPVQIALVAFAPSQPPVLQIEGGLEFRLPNAGSLSGLTYCNSNRVAACEKAAGDFTTLRPGRTLTGSLKLFAPVMARDVGPVKRGRFSGVLFVRESEGGKGWMEPFTIADVQVVNRVR
jgi:hypothetical protein